MEDKRKEQGAKKERIRVHVMKQRPIEKTQHEITRQIGESDIVVVGGGGWHHVGMLLSIYQKMKFRLQKGGKKKGNWQEKRNRKDRRKEGKERLIGK